jgi:FkbM family methyltransferase
MPNLKKSEPYAKVRASLLCLAGNAVVGGPITVARGLGHMRELRRLAELNEARVKVVDTDSDGFMLWSTPTGPVWTAPDAGSRFTALLTAEEALDVYRWGSTSTRTRPTVIDCGGNVGVFSRQAFARGAERVIAFEPSSSNREAMRRNLSKEYSEGRLTIREEGVWHEQSRLFLETVTPTNPGANRVVSAPQGEMAGEWISLTTIDHVVAELTIPRVDFIKMDIEGAELNALRGAARTLRTHTPHLAIAVEHTKDAAANAGAVHKYLVQNAGYRVRGDFYRVNPRRIVFPEMLYAAKS